MKYKLNRFGSIDLKDIINKLKKNDRDSINLIQYSNLQLQLNWNLDEIDELKDKIKKLQKDSKELYGEMEGIYNKNPHLSEDYVMSFNISKQNKKLSDGKITPYWIINLKYRGSNKSIYLGSNEKVREIVGKEIGVKKKLEEGRLKSEIYDMCYDKLLDLVVKEKKNLFDMTIRFEDLI
jgi:FtsZ-binding cell division protein ZapB